jgi:hypothetical integral membrane protein (TIGR02206 family)
VTISIAVLGTVNWLVQQGYYLLIVRDMVESFPLHICDLAAILGPIALVWPKRLLRTILYFWAMGLSIWGLLTPVLQQGPGTPVFWLFWINHGAVMLYAFYDVIVRGYRPYVGDFGMALIVSLAYVAVVLPFNLALGWNYGYLGNVESEAWTPLDLMPPWPWRNLGIEILGALMLGLAWWPWAVARWMQRRGDHDPPPRR